MKRAGVRPVKRVDRGWDRILRELAAANNSFVKVGIQEGDTTKDGLNLAEVAATNEYGSSDGHIPERSFIRSTVDMQQRAVSVLKVKLLRQIYSGSISSEQALRLLGEFMQAKIKRRISTFTDPPNAPSTIERKGSSQPLIDTSHMRNSIRYVKGRK